MPDILLGAQRGVSGMLIAVKPGLQNTAVKRNSTGYGLTVRGSKRDE